MNIFQKINEVWIDIKDYEGYYQVSNLGRIRTVKRNTKNQFKDKSLIRKLEQRNNGYLAVRLYKDNKSKKFNVHRLVAEAFIKNKNNYAYVNHINGDKQDNRVDNLEWCTASENMKHAIKQGLIDLKKHQKAVIQYDKNMKIIKEWDSIKEAEKVLGINHGHITEVCRGKNYRKHAGGFIWKYKEVV